MEVAEKTTTEKVENDTLQNPSESPARETSEDESAPKKAKLENNETSKASPNKERAPRKMRKLEKIAQEGEALLKELGIDNAGDDADGNRRRTRSQARGISAPSPPVERTPRRGRKSKEGTDNTGSARRAKGSDSSSSNNRSTRKGRGRGRPARGSSHPKDEAEENHEGVAEDGKGQPSAAEESNKNKEDATSVPEALPEKPDADKSTEVDDDQQEKEDSAKQPEQTNNNNDSCNIINDNSVSESTPQVEEMEKKEEKLVDNEKQKSEENGVSVRDDVSSKSEAEAAPTDTEGAKDGKEETSSEEKPVVSGEQ